MLPRSPSPEARPGSLVGKAQKIVRDTISDALNRDDRGAERIVQAAFRPRLPLPILDLAAVELAWVLGEETAGRADRVGRLIEAAVARGAAPVALIGDSHSAHLVRRGWRDGRWLLPLHGLCNGASARGLANKGARAGAGAKVRRLLNALAPTPIPVVFKFGQVDVEFIFTFKRLSDRQGHFDPSAFDAFADQTIKRYVGFLVEATPPALRDRVQVAGIFPPALSDAAWRNGFVDAHIAELHGLADRAALGERLAGLSMPSLAERTRLHKRFNAHLYEAAGAAGFGVMDTFDALLGPQGTLAPRFLGKKGDSDHHLGYAATRDPVLKAVWAAAGG